MKAWVIGAAIIVVAVIVFGPTEGAPLSTKDTPSTLKKTAGEQSYLSAVEQYNGGEVNYSVDKEGEYVSWGKAICAQLDMGKEYDVAVTHSPGWPQDAFGRAAATFLCPRHIGKLPKLRS